MSETVIKVRHLHRRFGNFAAVKDLSFDIQRGSVVGFIGANGAGKTTTMRILSTLDLPTSGYLEVCGHDVIQYPEDVRRHLGWMPDNYGSYRNMTVWEYLDFFARAYGLKGALRRERLDDVIAFTDLGPLTERPMNRLSKGQAQRLCLGRTLLHDPDVLILDEPAAGLDPKARIEFKNLVRILADRGKTVFISSHILSELGEMCNWMLFIDEGKLIHEGAADSLRYRETESCQLRVRVSGEPTHFFEWITQRQDLRLVERFVDGGMVEIPSCEDADIARILRQMVGDGLLVTEFHREQQKLEDAFVHILKNKHSDGAKPQ